MDTGFGITFPAVGYNWSVHITAPEYNRYHNYRGGLFFRTTWTNTPDAVATIPRGAFVSAYVVTGDAYLPNGLVCSTGHPTDLEPIY